MSVQSKTIVDPRLTILLIATVSCGRGVIANTATPPERSYSVHITFTAPDSLAPAAEEYRRIWAAEGDRMVDAMERVAGLRFVHEHYADTNIRANVIERASNSGFRDSPMTMRASYPAWNSALASDSSGRALRWREIRDERLRTRR